MCKLVMWINKLLLCMCLMTAHQAYAALVDIVVNQTGSPDPIAAGGLLTYTITVTNNGPDDATGVVLTDTIPASTTFVSSSTTKGSCSGNPTVTCNIGALANGESATVTIRVIPTVTGSINNTASAIRNEPDSSSTNDSDTDTTTIQLGTDLSVTKTDSADPVAQGDNFNYLVVARNNGPYAVSASDTLTITDNIPTGVRVRAAPTGSGWTCTPPVGGYPKNGPFALTCTRTGIALAVNTNAPTLTIPVTALSLGTITNQVSLNSTPINDDNTANDTATQSTTVNQAADVAISKSVSQSGNLGQGQNYTYTLTPTLVVGTTGTITVTDTLPASVQLLSTPTGTDWTCTPNSGFPIAGATVSCTHASASNSNITPLSLNNITVNFRPTATGTINNIATIAAGVTDNNPSNNTSNTVNNTVINDASLTKTVSQTGNIGQNNTYTYTLSPSLVMGTTGTITVTDTFPSGASLMSAPTGTGWTCNHQSGFPLAGPLTITCTKPSAGNAGTTPLSLNNISFTFRPTVTGSLNNTATIAIGVTDTNSGNNGNTVNNTVLNDLQVVKTVNTNGFLGVGSSYRYTLTPTLVMGDSGGIITLEDIVPTGVSFTSIQGATFNAGPNNYTVGAWTCTITNPPTNNLTVPAPGNGTNKITCTQPSTTHSGPGLSLGTVQPNFTVTGLAGTTVTNTATISSPAADTNPPNNSSSVTRTIAAAGSANLTMNKTASTSATSVGTPFSYTLTVTNQGPANKPNGQVVTIEDIIPNGITFTGINGATYNAGPNNYTVNGWTCTVTNPPSNNFQGGAVAVGDGTNKVTCTRSDALNNGNSYARIVFNAIGTQGGLITNTGTVSAAFGSHSETADVTFSAAFDLIISKSDNNPSIGNASYGPDPLAVGDTVDYRLRVNNTGPNNVPAGVQITVTDTIPAGTTYISAVGVTAAHNWSCPAGPLLGPTSIMCTRTVTGVSGNVLNSSGGNGISNSDIRFTLRADLLANITNDVNVAVTAGTSESNSANNDASATTTVRQSSDMSITKTASVASLYAGQNLTYTITVTNNGSAATGINNVSVTDDMTTNPNASFVSVSAPAGWNCNDLSNLICDYNNSLASGASASFDVTVKMLQAGNPRNNTANVGFRRSGSTYPVDPNPSNNSATVGVQVLNALDLFVTKTDAPDPVKAGTNLTYVITVGNTGPGTANTVTMVDTLPSELILSSIQPSGSGTCTTSPSSTTYTNSVTTVNPRSAFTTLTCVWPSLIATENQTVTIIGRPTNAAATAGSISNSATVSHANNVAVPDIDLSNNSVTEPTVVEVAHIDLLVNKVDTPDPVARYTNMVYTITVQNQGPSVATNVVLTENLPHTYLTYISNTVSQGSCGAPVSNTMTCNLGNLEVNATATITITMSADALGVDTNTVSVTATEFDTNTANNATSENTTVQLGADLVLSKLATPDPVIAGNAIIYYLKVTNNGPANASNTVITDTLPTGVAFDSYTASQGTCSHNTGVVTCNLGLVPYGKTAQVTLVATAMVGGLQNNTATVSASTPDPNTADNTATAPVTVLDGIVRGRVFADNGLGTGTPNDGLQNGSEVGIGNVLVRLTNCAGTEYAVTQTNGTGDYQLIVPAALATGATLCVEEQNLSGYRNTGGSAGTTGGAYNITTDRTQFTYTDGVTYTGVNFADVAQTMLYTDGNQQTQPGTTVTYAHQFFAGTDGVVSFGISASASPNTFLWSQVLYRDSDCDAILDAGEPVVSGNYTVAANATICLIVKQFVPSNATQGAFNVVTVSSSFIYDTLAPTVTEVLTRTDTTTVGVGGTNTLSLHKAVNKATAKPGETITYTITYSNNGTDNLSNIVINDSVPAFTHGAVASCVMPLPANLTLCVPTINSPQILWNMTGTLAPSQQGQVQFSVTLDN